jgi:hypothetical protein
MLAWLDRVKGVPLTLRAIGTTSGVRFHPQLGLETCACIQDYSEIQLAK